MALKAKFRAETWIDLINTLLSAQISSKEPFVSIKQEPYERIYIIDVPPDTYHSLKDLKAKLKTKTWVEFLAIIATADINPSGAARPTSPKSEQEVS